MQITRWDNLCIGAQSRISDVGVFGSSSLRKKLQKNKLNLAEPIALFKLEEVVPYVLLGDDAFPLCSNIPNPYSGSRPLDKRSPRTTD